MKMKINILHIKDKTRVSEMSDGMMKLYMQRFYFDKLKRINKKYMKQEDKEFIKLLKNNRTLLKLMKKTDKKLGIKF